jgi:hypothetical protein
VAAEDHIEGAQQLTQAGEAAPAARPGVEPVTEGAQDVVAEVGTLSKPASAVGP